MSDIFRDVARTLSGHDVRVRHKQPPIRGLAGWACKRNGRLEIMVDPLLYGDAWLFAFLHELAHIKLHSWRFAETTQQDGPPASRDMSEDWKRDLKTNPDTMTREDEADALAGAWLQYARARTPSGILVDMLENLKHYEKD